MKRVANDVITANQFMFIMIGSIIGIGALSLPNDVIKDAKQSGWMSAFLGAVYPLYIVIAAGYIQKKSPNKNILFVNKKCYGKVIGNILNIFLFLFFLLIITSEINGLSNIIRTAIVGFLTPLKVYIAITFLGAYTAYKGLKVIGRANETVFYLSIIMISLAIWALFKGKISNVTPMFGSSILNIVKASKESAYQYIGMEMYLLIYPYVSENKDLKKLALKGIFIIALIYTWITFITIYALGIDIIPRVTASFLLTEKYIEVPFINNFRFIFIVLWSLMVFVLISNYYYAEIHILHNLFPKISENKFCFIIYPFIVFLSIKYVNFEIRKNFLSYIIPKVTAAMVFYILITVILIYIKGGNRLE
ncbi:GerAB/ArcD/ProY family transporter [Clostridium drakei]|uniref:Uncharacterized protein n=1 Tax=Clostridium drakei TaxID=332101 RepID=A0A2U8DU44_9CLOT|nr:GerAB/ArcD/ProY family transporter [Clostridium drakei]AWI05592.1 hypothetical protein B9W14_14125 [Clostridium drakei]